jgi:hypothetical protein
MSNPMRACRPCADAAGENAKAMALPPRNVTNSRRFTARCSSASNRKNSTGGGLLRCGISIRPMSQMGLKLDPCGPGYMPVNVRSSPKADIASGHWRLTLRAINGH